MRLIDLTVSKGRDKEALLVKKSILCKSYLKILLYRSYRCALPNSNLGLNVLQDLANALNELLLKIRLS